MSLAQENPKIHHYWRTVSLTCFSPIIFPLHILPLREGTSHRIFDHELLQKLIRSPQSATLTEIRGPAEDLNTTGSVPLCGATLAAVKPASWGGWSLEDSSVGTAWCQHSYWCLQQMCLQGKLDTKILPRTMKYRGGWTPLAPTHELALKITLHSVWRQCYSFYQERKKTTSPYNHSGSVWNRK